MLIYLGEKKGVNASLTTDSFTSERIFQIKATANENPVTIIANENIPAINSAHPSNSALKCVSKNIEPSNDDADVYKITCGYEIKSMSFTYTPGADYPWEEPPFNISFGSVPYNKVLKKSYDTDDEQGQPSKAVLNSANDSFDPPLEFQQFNSILRFSYNVKNFRLSQITNFKGTINKSGIPVLGISITPKHGRMNEISATKKNVKDADGNVNYSYFELNVEIEISETPYKSEPLDIGFHYLDGDKKKEIMLSDINSDITAGDENDEPVTEPQLLDGSGGILSAGDDPEYLEYQPYFSKNWQTLNLPKTME